MSADLSQAEFVPTCRSCSGKAVRIFIEKVWRPGRIGGYLLSYGSLTRSIRPPRRMNPSLSLGIQGKRADFWRFFSPLRKRRITSGNDSCWQHFSRSRKIPSNLSRRGMSPNPWRMHAAWRFMLHMHLLQIKVKTVNHREITRRTSSVITVSGRWCGQCSFEAWKKSVPVSQTVGGLSFRPNRGLIAKSAGSAYQEETATPRARLKSESPRCGGSRTSDRNRHSPESNAAPCCYLSRRIAPVRSGLKTSPRP